MDHTLLESPLAFLQPRTQIPTSFLEAAKRYLDPVAAGISDAQSQRQLDQRRKRKRGGDNGDDINVLHLRKVHVSGFGIQQVYEQARKVVSAVLHEVELSLPEQEDDVVAVLDNEEQDEDLEDAEEYHSESSLGEEGVDWEYDGVDEDRDEHAEAIDGGQSDDVDMEDEEEDIFSDEEEDADDEPAEIYQPDPNGLNDGFFSIDDFNKQTNFAEQQDIRGEAADSEDDSIHWDADPMTDGPATTKANGVAGGAFEDDDTDEDGPTFGDVDLNADSDDDNDFEEGDLDGIDDDMQANNVMYADFFAPPATKAGKGKKGRKSFTGEEPTKADEMEDDVEAVAARVHRDLFEDDDEVDSEGDLSDVDPADPKSRRSTHARRQAKIADEIRKLEAENVARKQWQLSGEARAADRPLNSLLEESLDFERAGKPVPLITEEVSEDLEALIKRRIIAEEFDEIHRRRPDDLATGPRRGRVELDDAKSGKGLAEIYEEQHLREIDPNFVEAKDEKL
jgi:U3 small nucleolar RNA-associated protein MPP10